MNEWIVYIVLILFLAASGMLIYYLKAYARIKNQIQTYENIIQRQEKLSTMGRFTAGIIHEIKNSLNFSINFSEIVIEQLEDIDELIKKENVAENLDEISEEIKTAIENVQQVIDYESNANMTIKVMLDSVREGKLQKSPTDIHKMIDKTLKLCHSGFSSEDQNMNFIITKDYDESIPEVSMVPQEIIQVLTNLIINAYNAMIKKSKSTNEDYAPEIKIKTQDYDNQIEIAIEDNGVGISDDQMDKIFLPLYTTSPNEGTGLGLSLCEEMIIKHHNGAINVKSEVNEYTVFTVTLPKNPSQD